MRSQLLYGCLVVLAACNGTRTGNPGDEIPDMRDPDSGMPSKTDDPDNSGGLTGEYGGPNCKATATALESRDADTALGFSAADILAFAAGVHETKIRWQSQGFGSAAPESGEHGLTLRIEPTSAKPRVVTYEQVEQDGGVGGSGGLLIDLGELPQATCESFNAIEIDVTLAIMSDGGALDETLNGTLRATNTSWASLEIRVDAEDLNGSFHIVGAKVGNLDFTLQRLQIGLGVSPLGVRGQISGEFMSEDAGAATGGGSTSTAAGGGGIAQIGANEQCDPDGLPVELDQQLKQFAAQDAIDLIDDAPALALTWQDGSETTLDLEFTSEGALVCAVIEPNALSAATDAGFLRMRGKLAVHSADDRIDGDWPVVIEAKPTAEGALGDVGIVFDGPNLSQSPIRDLAGEYGVQGIDATGYDGANIMFSLQFVAGTTDDLTGMLTISGLTQPMCAPPPSEPGMSSPGCAGIGLTTLESATLSVP